MKKTVLYLINAVTALSLVLLLLYISIIVPALFKPFYTMEYEKNGTYEYVGISKEELSKVTDKLIKYTVGFDKELNISTVIDGNERLFFSEREILHMSDVQVLFKNGHILAFAALIVFAACTFYKKSDKKFFAYISRFLISSCILLVLSILTVSMNFNYFFNLFHHIFFANDLWVLDSRVDLLIRIVPQRFFIDISIFIGILFFIGMILAGFIFRRLGKEKP